MMKDWFAKKREDERSELLARAENCAGYEQLSPEEIDSIEANDPREGHYGPIVKVGYRCGNTAETGIATTYTHGVVGLSVRHSSVEPVQA